MTPTLPNKCTWCAPETMVTCPECKVTGVAPTDPPKLTHADCVKFAALYIAKRYPVTLPEFFTHNAELPDVIGFRADESVVVECKVSRGDYLSDKKKSFRMRPEKGMGDRRYYCCPKGMISKEELPVGWGLLYVYPSGQVRKIKNSYIPPDESMDPTEVWKYAGDFEKDTEAEMHILYYYARRAYYAGVHSTILAYRGFDG